MAFPTDLDSFTDPQATDKRNSPSLATTITNIHTAVESVETKLGVDSSAVVTSIDYLLKNTSSSDPGHKHTLANSATDVTASAAELNIMDGGETTEKVLNVQSKSRATRNTTQSIPDNALTRVQFDTEVYDIGSDYDNATNYNFTAPVTGYYDVRGQVRLNALNSGVSMIISIFVGGVEYMARGRETGNASENMTLNISDIVKLTAGQTVDIRVFHNHGFARDTHADAKRNVFSVHLLSV